MAGIGFELRKAIRQESVKEKVGGYLGAAFSSSGSILVGIVIFVLIQTAAKSQHVSQHILDNFMCYVTNTMFLSMLFTSLLTLALSRYVSNQLYLEKQEKVMPSLIGGSLLVFFLSLVIFLPIVVTSKLDALSGLFLYILFMVLCMCWLLMTYITLVRDYVQIIFAYLGALLGSGLLLIIFSYLGLMRMPTMILTLMTGFAVVDIFLFRIIYNGFARQDDSIFEYFSEIKAEPALVLIGFLMMIGMLGHFWIVWFFSDIGTKVDTFFRFGPAYDFPAIIAYFSTIPATIYFVTFFETAFSEKYQRYFKILGKNGTVEEIQEAKEGMFDVMYRGFRSLCTIQIVVCLIFITIGAKTLGVMNIGMSRDMADTFRIFCVGYSLYYIGNVITLVQLYFMNEKRVVWSALFFAVFSNLFTYLGIQRGDGSWGIGFMIIAFVWAAIGASQLVGFLTRLEFNILGKQPLTPSSAQPKNKHYKRSRLNVRIPIYALAVSLCLAVGSLGMMVFDAYQSTFIMNFKPKASDKVLRSPGMGLAPWAESPQTKTLNTSLVYVELPWSLWEPEEGKYAVDYVKEHYKLDYYKADGRQVVFRFFCDQPTDQEHMDIPQWLYNITKDGTHYDNSYGKGYSPNYANPVFMDRHNDAVSALGDAFGDDDFFCYVEVGSLGHWGEWYVNKDENVPILPPQEIRDQYLDTYKEAFPNAKLLMRFPMVEAKAQNYGLYNDMTGDPEETQYWREIIKGGVWDQTGEDVLADCRELWKTAPIGGEFATTPDDRAVLVDNYNVTLETLRENHQSFLGPKIIIDELESKHVRENLDQILLQMGYRFRVTGVRMNFKPVSSFSARISMVNEGNAPIYSDSKLRVYLFDEEGGEVLDKDVAKLDLKTIMPGQKTSFSVDINQEELSSDHVYSLGLAIVNEDGEPAVPMAMEETLADNIYKLAKFKLK